VHVGEAFAEGLTPSDFFSVEGADEHGEASNAHLLMQARAAHWRRLPACCRSTEETSYVCICRV
jgi:hypothetical protein